MEATQSERHVCVPRDQRVSTQLITVENTALSTFTFPVAAAVSANPIYF